MPSNKFLDPAISGEVSRRHTEQRGRMVAYYRLYRLPFWDWCSWYMQ